MRNAFAYIRRHPLGKLVIIEVFILGFVALLSVAIGFTYSTGLMLVGIVILFLRFGGGFQFHGLASGRGAFTYEMEKQYLHDIKDPKQMKAAIGFMTDLLVIGIIPLLMGIALSFLRL